jgi:UDP-N-acetylglucosamine 4,6-dehydratase
MVGGELFVPKIPSATIIDLAEVIAPECRKEIIGVRAGEKLHEVMVPRDDARNTVEFDDHYVIKPQFRYFERRFCDNECKSVPDDFEYNAGTNPWRLTVEDIRTLLGRVVDSPSCISPDAG